MSEGGSLWASRGLFFDNDRLARSWARVSVLGVQCSALPLSCLARVLDARAVCDSIIN